MVYNHGLQSFILNAKILSWVLELNVLMYNERIGGDKLIYFLPLKNVEWGVCVKIELWLCLYVYVHESLCPTVTLHVFLLA